MGQTVYSQRTQGEVLGSQGETAGSAGDQAMYVLQAIP